MTRLWAGWPWNQTSIPSWRKRFLSSPLCLDQMWGQPTLLLKWVLGDLCPEIRQLGYEGDHTLHLILRLRMSGAIPQLLQVCMESTGTIYFLKASDRIAALRLRFQLEFCWLQRMCNNHLTLTLGHITFSSTLFRGFHFTLSILPVNTVCSR